MNTQNVKQAHEMTNKELFDELKKRGFFMFEELNIYGRAPYVLVANERPNKDVLIDWTHRIFSGEYEEIETDNIIISRAKYL
ncbi:hypothetical protein [Chryseobacterium carnipullorum]|uniref:hypothetical protein n=1 Tax=Chryseobacterium carnipullorum TaxID=1124835 RepID=UPI000E9E8818|nr:hypothetical protein [Chryseobacterium carnipullorum]HBV16096.1 hypothetical protein [Chryseobacterium carnipullorum]